MAEKSKTNKGKVNEILENISRSRAKRQKKQEKWKELDAFDRNEQWDLNNAPNWLPKPVTNFVHLVKYTKRAAFAVENPTGKIRAISPSGTDKAKMLNKAYEDTFTRIKLRSTVRDCIADSRLLGTAIAHLYWDENYEGRLGSTVQGDEGFMYEGEIRHKVIDIGSFYPDPDAFTIDECKYIAVRERKNADWVKKNPKFKDKFKKDEPTDEHNNPEERGEIYLRDYGLEQKDGLIDFISYYTKEMNDEGGFTYSVEYIAGGKYLLKEKLKPNRYPFAILYDFQQRHDFWGMGTCELILDNQKIINKVESIITMIATLMQNPQKIVSKSSGIDPSKVALYGNLPGQTWESNDADPSRSIRYVETPQIPVTLLNLLDTAKGNIREITGLSESYMGQNVGSLQTSSGVQALIDRSTMRDRDQMYDIELFVEDLSKLLIDFMKAYYEEPRLLRIFDNHGEVINFEEFVGTDFADLEYDMAIDVSSKAPITRMREINDAKELLNLQGQYGANYPVQIIKPQEAIPMMNLVHGQQIVDRMNMEEMNNQVEKSMQVAQMIAEAQQQGVPPEDLQKMATEMFMALENPQAQAGAGNQMGDLSNGNPQNIPQGV